MAKKLDGEQLLHLYNKEGPLEEWELEWWEERVERGAFDRHNAYVQVTQVRRLIADNRRLRNQILDMLEDGY